MPMRRRSRTASSICQRQRGRFKSSHSELQWRSADFSPQQCRQQKGAARFVSAAQGAFGLAADLKSALRHPPLRAVLQRRYSLFVRAVRAAKHRARSFHTVPNYLAAAMLTLRRQRVNGAFEAIEIMRHAIDDNLKRLVVFIFADFTFSHNHWSPSRFRRLRSARAALVIWSDRKST